MHALFPCHYSTFYLTTLLTLLPHLVSTNFTSSLSPPLASPSDWQWDEECTKNFLLCAPCCAVSSICSRLAGWLLQYYALWSWTTDFIHGTRSPFHPSLSLLSLFLDLSSPPALSKREELHTSLLGVERNKDNVSQYINASVTRKYCMQRWISLIPSLPDLFNARKIGRLETGDEVSGG